MPDRAGAPLERLVSYPGKRLLDLVAASLLLLAATPLLPVVALMVRLSMGSPVLFRQVRPGLFGRPFGILKLRTMTDARGPDGSLRPDGERLTALGRFLRSSSLDELPELVNVIRGEMSLVGPRPLLDRYMPYFRPRERLRFNARPGITGLAQVSGRNLLTWDQRLEFDAVYVETMSFRGDLTILARTVWGVIRREGVSADRPGGDLARRGAGAGDRPARPGPRPRKGPPVKATLLRPDDPRWTDLLGRVRHEFYHRPAYLRIEADRLGGEPVAVHVDNGSQSFLLPLVVREIDSPALGGAGPCRDAVSPYGYPGPLVVADEGDRADLVRLAISASLPVLRDAGVVSAFVRLNPILNRREDFAQVGHLVEHGSCVWIDLTLSESELQQHLRGRYRSYLNGMQRAGVVVSFDESFDRLSTFLELYHKTMDRVEAESWYYFDRLYFDRLAEVLGQDLKLAIVEHQGQVAAAGLFVASDGVVQYLFSGTDENVEQPHATKAMIVFVRDWARSSGHSVLQLGGGLGGRADSLAWFKRGFSKLSCPFFTWRLVVDRARYDALVDAWQASSGEPAESPDGYFPAYRKPLVP